MTPLTREELVDELTIANEEADYHSERANQLEVELRRTTALLRHWWGAYSLPQNERNLAYVRAIYDATQQTLIYIDKAEVL